MDWRSIKDDPPPKDREFLAWGKHSGVQNALSPAWRPSWHVVYWDAIDGAFCVSGATWLGPFIEPTHWQPLPAPPSKES